jgi:hypothetical protein
MEATAFKESLEKWFEMIEERPYEDEQIEDEDDNDE